MKFYALSQYPKELNLYVDSFILIHDNWNDWFRYETLCNVYYITYDKNAITDYEVLKHMDIKYNANKPNSEYETKALLKTMETEKNLLLYLPFIFIINENYPLFQKVYYISEALMDTYGDVLKYRETSAKGFETYLGIIHNNLFIIYKYNDSALETVDYICTEKSRTFGELMIFPIM